MKLRFNKYQYPVFFWALMLGLCIYYGYIEQFHFTPRSTHQWRQADSASLVKNYYQDGLNFFKPRMHYAMNGDGYVTGAGEAPVFYYLAAIGYKIFGPKEGIYRLLSLLTFLLGLFLIGKILAQNLDDWWSPVILTGLIMGAPVIAFYSFNFTPNVPAQGLAMIGIYFFYQYYKKRKLRFFYWSMFFYALAGLIKISALMSFIVIVGLFVLDLLGLLHKDRDKKLFQQAWRFIPAFLLVAGAIYGWKLWADHYNEVHQTKYFLSTTRPVWAIDGGRITYIFTRIKTVWLPSYFSLFTLGLLAACLLFLLFTPRKHARILYLSLLALFLGCLSFFALWFQQFEGHDYYVIELILLPILILSMVLIFLKKRFPRFFTNWFFRIALLIFVFYNAYHARYVLDFRYDQKNVFMSYFNPDLYKTKELQEFLRGLGIQYPDKVISAPDTSPNNTLYHYNLIGWTELYLGGQMHTAYVKSRAKAGAKYLIINKKEYLEKENLKEVLAYPLGNFNNSIFVFDIRPFKEG